MDWIGFGPLAGIRHALKVIQLDLDTVFRFGANPSKANSHGVNFIHQPGAIRLPIRARKHCPCPGQ